jgi:3'(2'), 5'-bisphosphate nucleotidase
MSIAASSTRLEQLLEPVAEIAREASRRILQVYETDFSVTEKQDRSPLTEADLASHRAIVSALERLTPDLPVLSEESAQLPYTTRSTWQRYWLVDPLDGTKEFIKRNGEFTVNIALIEEHRPVLGVVHVPVADVTYLAAVGVGAFKRWGGAQQALKTRTAVVDELVVVASRSHAGETLETLLGRLPNSVQLISKGSSLKLCLVAEGTADIYPRFGPTSEWDTAAAQCVVEQAGGCVLSPQFQPLSYNAKADIRNPHFFVLGDPSFDWQSRIPQGS